MGEMGRGLVSANSSGTESPGSPWRAGAFFKRYFRSRNSWFLSGQVMRALGNTRRNERRIFLPAWISRANAASGRGVLSNEETSQKSWKSPARITQPGFSARRNRRKSRSAVAS